MIDSIITMVGMVLSLFFLSSLYGKKNPFFSLAMSLLLGASMGYLVVFTVGKIYNSSFFSMLNGNYAQILPLLLGLLLFTRYVPKYSALARIPIAITAGTMLGVTIRTILFTEVIGFTKSTIVPLFVSGDPYQSFLNLSTVVLTVSILTFFIYTVRRKGPIKYSAKLGEYALYAALGGIAANTYLGYVSSTVGVFKPYVESNLILFVGLGVLIAAATYYLDVKGLLEKYSE